MLFWILSSFLFLTGIRKALGCALPAAGEWLFDGEAARLRALEGSMRSIQESVEAGLVPGEEAWRGIGGGSAWGGVCGDALNELRSAGAPVLPTVRRLRSRVVSDLNRREEARSKGAQALFQGGAIAALVPFTSWVLHAVVAPDPSRAAGWLFWTCLAALVALAGAIWIFSLTDDARWGSLPREKRIWWMTALSSGEWLLARIQSGFPPDLAWSEVLERLKASGSGLYEQWDGGIWDETPERRRLRAAGTLERTIVEAGASFRAVIRQGLYDGKPCAARIASVIDGLESRAEHLISKKIGTLGLSTLKPLFLCIAPSYCSLLVLALREAWMQGGGLWI